MEVIKRNGTRVPYTEDKIIIAINKAFAAVNQHSNPEIVQAIIDNINIYDGITVEEIQNRVEEALMKEGYYQVAKAYMLYRNEHSEERMLQERLDYMEQYTQAMNAADGSETDANANVTIKNVANQESEVWKEKNRKIQRRRMKQGLQKLYPELVSKYEEDINNRILYVCDEASSPALKAYTYSPYESVEALYNGVHYLVGLKSLYNLVQGKEILEDSENQVYCKYPTGLQVMDKNGWTTVTRLTRKQRHRDLYRIKTAFGEDLIVTDNHPLIISDDPTNTIEAINSLESKQFRIDSKLTFDGIKEIDLAQIIDCDKVCSNFVATHETQAPYYFAKRYVKVDRNLGYVVGFFIGDGNYNNYDTTVRFAQKEKETIIKLEEALFESLGVVPYEHLGTHNSAGIWHMTVRSTIVFKLFKDYFGIKDKAPNKCLPLNLLQFNEDFALGIVEGLVDSDGTTQDNNRVNIRLSSRECITQLTKLLRYFGFNVSNTHQKSRPFSNNISYPSKYDGWGINFANTLNSTQLTNSYKWQKYINKKVTKSLKYSTGWSTITNVEKVDNGSFMDMCTFIYDITTESSTFDCNNLWVHNCSAVTLYPLMLEGTGNIDGVTPSAPNDIQSFSGQVTNLVFLLSSQVKGAVALGDYFIALNYYVIKEFGEDWYNKLDTIITTDICKKSKTVKDAIRKGMKQFIYGVNQPAGNRSYNSPFSNLSYYDKIFFTSLFEDFYYPDGTQPEWKAVDTLQRIFMELHRELRLIKPLTFPVTTMAMVHDHKDIIDQEYKKLCADEWAKGGSFFAYISDSATSLSSCCRVLNNVKNNTFSSTLGLTGIMTGSCNVLTLNLNRIVQNFYKENPQVLKTVKEFKEYFAPYFIQILDRVYKYHITYKTGLYDMEDKKMFTNSNAGYIHMNKLYNTIGLLGYCEAAQFLGLEISNNEEYKDFISYIFKVVKEQNQINSIQDPKRPVLFNTEAVPGENMAVKFYQWDKSDGYYVPEDQNLYSSYFFKQWDKNISVLDKLKLHGKYIADSTDGGQACHIHLMEHLTAEQYSKIIDICIAEGNNYFTFNIPMSECKDCGHTVNAPIHECPKCGSSNIDWWVRIIGFLRPISSWSKERQIEANKRVYSNGREQI